MSATSESIPAGLAHLADDQRVYCFPRREVEPNVWESSAVYLRLALRRDQFFVLGDVRNAIEGRHDEVMVPAELIEALARWVTDAIASVTAGDGRWGIGDYTVVHVFPQLQTRPGRQHFSMLKITLCDGDDIPHFSVLSNSVKAQQPVEVFLDLDQARELANALWREPQAPVTEDLEEAT